MPQNMFSRMLLSPWRSYLRHFASTDEIQISDEVDEINLDGIPAENREKYVKAALEKLPQVDRLRSGNIEGSQSHAGNRNDGATNFYITNG